MKVLDLAYERIDKKLDELEATDDYFRGLRVGLIDALELIDILDMELDGRLPAGDDVREHLNLPEPEPEPDWLARTLREAKAEAWEEGHHAGQHNEHEYRPGRVIVNPYKEPEA